MKELPHTFLAELDSYLRAQALTGVFQPKHVLTQLKSLGFHACLFYDAAPNPASEDYQIILSAVDGNGDQEKLLGTRIDFRDAAISRIDGTTGTVINSACDESLPEPSKELARQLSLFEKNRIHIPLRFKSELIGAITCSWEGEADIVKEEHRAALEVVASLFSKYWWIATEAVVDQSLAKIKEVFGGRIKDNTIQAILDQATNLINEVLKGRAAALFSYNWYTGGLSKISESFSEYHEELRIKEEYQVGRFVTGLAWENGKRRHIVDFEAYSKAFSQEVSTESKLFHTNAVGSIETILYSRFGVDNREYLLRLINRRDPQNMPFVTSHRILLDKITSEVARIVSKIEYERKLEGLQDVAKTAVENIKEPKKTFKRSYSQLEAEFAPGLLVICLDDNHEYICEFLSSIDLDNENISEEIDSENDSFFRSVLSGNQVVRFHDIRKYREIENPRHLLSKLKEKNVNLCITIRIQAYSISGFLLVPAANVEGSKTGLEGRIPKSHLDSLKAYAALIGACIESQQSHITAENAKRLVGIIGHEVQGPVAELGQQAIDALVKTADRIESLSGIDQSDVEEHVSYLIKTQGDIGTKMQTVNVLMDVAWDMAQETKGVLQVHFKEYELSDVLWDAKREVENNSEFTDAFSNPINYEIRLNQGCKNFRTMVGDPDLLLKVFVNIFRNAVKYSLPPGRRAPLIVDVYGQPQQGMSIVQVKNFGISIKPDEKEKIFQPFTRGMTMDRLKARRGMGLGLYVARRFVSAHHGKVFCQSSVPTFDDPNRRDAEGWESVFEIRLPLNLPLGTYDHDEIRRYRR